MRREERKREKQKKAKKVSYRRGIGLPLCSVTELTVEHKGTMAKKLLSIPVTKLTAAEPMFPQESCGRTFGFTDWFRFKATSLYWE